MTVLCLGEALALVTDLDAARPDDVRLAGAEANVAVGLAAAGTSASWVGRLGSDAPGAVLLDTLRVAGVEVAAVEIDADRPTGRYAKDTTTGPDGEVATRMRYRRAGSAASAMGPAFLRVPAVADRLAAAGIVHVTAITAALSPSCAALMRKLLDAPRRHLVTLDVNWREQMWPDGDTAPVVALAGAADVVLSGADEAERVFGTGDPHHLRDLLPRPRLLVVKEGARRVRTIDRAGVVTAVPALAVEVVEPVGAGDAFAAGLLTGLVRGENLTRCLRRGHLGAAAVLTVAGDSTPPLNSALLELDDTEWSALRVRPGPERALTTTTAAASVEFRG